MFMHLTRIPSGDNPQWDNQTRERGLVKDLFSSSFLPLKKKTLKNKSYTCKIRKYRKVERKITIIYHLHYHLQWSLFSQAFLLYRWTYILLREMEIVHIILSFLIYYWIINISESLKVFENVIFNSSINFYWINML